MASNRSQLAPLRLYIFLDEAGNLDFGERGTRYFTLTSVCKLRPFHLTPYLDSLKFDLIESGLDIEYFHASEDQQRVRNRVFEIIEQNLCHLQINSLVVEKAQVHPAVQDDLTFYPVMLGSLLRSVVQEEILRQYRLGDLEEILVITDSLPVQKKRKAVEKAIKTTLKQMLPPSCRFRVMHHASKSNFGLQAADYCNWAVFRKWERGDNRSYDRIKPQIHTSWRIKSEGKSESP